jgi:ATP-dependent protease Clp ATPase subunit
VFEQYDIDIPVVQIDLSQITETGYKGNDTSSIPKSVLMEAPDMGGVGICFLDEADKKCKPSFGSNGVDNNAAAQANLLTLVEGIKVDVELEGKAKKFDSSKTMFVFMGAFQDIRNEKIERATSKPQIGFMSEDENASEADVATDIFFDELTIQDIIDFGMLEELAGRIMQVVNFHKLEEKDMRNLIASKVKDISAETGIKIRVTDEGVDGLVKIAYGNLGVRHPMNVIKELALNTVAALFFDGDFDRDKDTVVITSAEEAYVEKGKGKKKGEK